jgi:hypothetical protein
MSPPVREPERGPSADGPLNYAPKRVRHPEPHPNPADASPKGDAEPRSTVRESTEAPWRRSKQRGAFAGDVAITQLRTKLALAPDRLPEPPISTGPRYSLAGQLTSVVVVAAAAGVIGYQWGSALPTQRPQLLSGRSNQQASAHPPLSAEPVFAPPAAVNGIVQESNERNSRDAASSRAVSPRLTVSAVPPQQADEAARLTVSVKDAGAKAAVVIGGLASGSALSAGAQLGPNTWRLSAEEATRAVITPPAASPA